MVPFGLGLHHVQPATSQPGSSTALLRHGGNRQYPEVAWSVLQQSKLDSLALDFACCTTEQMMLEQENILWQRPRCVGGSRRQRTIQFPAVGSRGPVPGSATQGSALFLGLGTQRGSVGKDSSAGLGRPSSGETICGCGRLPILSSVQN